MKSKRKRYCTRDFMVAWLLCIVLITGCATGYHSSGVTGGYQDTKIQDGMYRISFQGNAAASEQRSADFAMLRASEVALRDGFPYFVILEGKTSSSSRIYSVEPTGAVGTVSEPSSNMVIQCYKEKPSDGRVVYDAVQVKENIKRQYSL